MRVVQDRLVARAYDDINCVAFDEQLELFGDTIWEETTLATTWPLNWTHALNDKNREYPQENSVPIKGEYDTRRVNSEHNPEVVLVKEGTMLEKPWQYTTFRKTLPHWYVSELIWHKLADTISWIVTEKRHQDNYLKITPGQTQRGNHTWVRYIQPIWNTYTTNLCVYWKTWFCTTCIRADLR